MSSDNTPMAEWDAAYKKDLRIGTLVSPYINDVPEVPEADQLGTQWAANSRGEE